MRTYLRETLYPNMDSDLKSMIVPVKKYTRIFQASDEAAVNNVETTETVYLLSDREVFGSSGYETIGAIYSDALTSWITRRRKKYAAASYTGYLLRSSHTKKNFRYVYYGGGQDNISASTKTGVVVAFNLDIPST